MAKSRPGDEYALFCREESKTQEHFADECDINQIIARAEKGAVITHLNERAPIYLDLVGIPSYQDAFNVVKRAEAAFMTLPWQARERFGNNPQKLLEFLQDPKNRDEAVKLGLMKAPEAPVAPPNGDVTPQPAPAAGKAAQ